MPSRFYFSTTAHALSPITPRADWERSIAAAVTKQSPTVKSNTALADTAALMGSTATSQTRWMSFLTDPLPTNFTFTTAHTVSMVVRGLESGLTEDAHLAFVLRVMQGDTSTERGLLLAFMATSTEFTTAAQTRIHAARAFGANVNALAGDRLCLEVGIHAVTAANAANITLRFGDPSGTADFALTSGLTTDLCPWWEISPDVFASAVVHTGDGTAAVMASGTAAGGSVKLGQATAGATMTADGAGRSLVSGSGAGIASTAAAGQALLLALGSGLADSTVSGVGVALAVLLGGGTGLSTLNGTGVRVAATHTGDGTSLSSATGVSAGLLIALALGTGQAIGVAVGVEEGTATACRPAVVFGRLGIGL